MQERQILSGDGHPAADAVRPVLVFDACRVGVVLRAVLYVLGVLGVGLMYVSDHFAGWLARFAFVTGGALPATLLWLVVGCSLKSLMGRLSWSVQVAAGMALGALAGLFACAALMMVMPEATVHWLAGAATGTLLAAGLVAGLIWRVRGRAPATTVARLAELQSRIHPHFLFNTLNTAIALVREEPDRAERVLEDLSDLFRSALTDPREQSTLAQEIALARQYLEIEQLRFGGRLRVRWQLDDRAGDAHVPSLVLQPLVENAIRHGVEPSADGADLAIHTWVRGRMASVEVTNSCPAGPGPAGQGMATANVRDRVRLLHDVEGGFRSGLRGGIYRACIEVPLPDPVK